jgi:hypothetical protein
MHTELASSHTMLYPAYSDSEVGICLQTQEVIACRHLPLEHHVRTRSEHPIGGDSSPKIQQETEQGE